MTEIVSSNWSGLKDRELRQWALRFSLKGYQLQGQLLGRKALGPWLRTLKIPVCASVLP